MRCDLCDDTGWTAVEIDGARRVERCDCWRSGLTVRLLDEARIPPRYRRCDLETFTTYPNEKLLAAVKQARRFADEFPAFQKGLCLIGPPGIGKTPRRRGAAPRRGRRRARQFTTRAICCA
jgi:DNA replication protein DnaC